MRAARTSRTSSCSSCSSSRRSTCSSAARALALAAALCCSALALSAPAASAAAPGWTLAISPLPANFAPGQESEYAVVAANVGAAPTTGETEVKVTIPAGMAVSTFNAGNTDPEAPNEPTCTALGQVVTCKTAEAFHPGYLFRVKVGVTIPSGAPEEVLTTQATISGGGATQAIAASSPTPVQEDAVPFDFLPGFKAPATDEDAEAELLAGAHPYQQTVFFGFPTKNPGDGVTNDGHPRNFYVELPRGMVGFPGASKALCTEAELVSSEGCPDASQVGVADVTTLAGEVGISDVLTSNLYNMVPPPGSAAELATNVANIGVFVHAQGSLRTESDYGVQVATRDVIAFGQQPIFNVQAQVWGNPTEAAHDEIRGRCGTFGGACPVEDRGEAFLAMPGECTGAPSLFEVLADSWEEPSPPAALQRASYESAGLGGDPALLEGCEELEFEPAIEAQPTTDVSDSPSGLDFTLRQPTDTAFESRSPAILKDATVRFPAGMVVNPSQAGGLGACSLSQIGYLSSSGGTPHFSDDPQSCPNAAKLGTVEVTSPALVRRNADHEVEEEEGEAILEPLQGSIYIAQPFQNPFGSLIAVYLAIEDPKTGIVAKLAGEGHLDPQSGQVSTSFRESPEMPLSEVSVHLFGGPRGAFITPPTCGNYSTAAELGAWSGAQATPASSFAIAAAPSGGACPAAEAQMPNAPKLSAGTLNPAAGKYSPLLFKLSREDGSQRIGRIEATLPTGLSAKLAGVASCSEQDIAKARSREAPEQGALELADPSCPASSEIASVLGAAGAGPTPYYTSGRAYLAGPYKGAPISLVAIVPAIAGPFDLGTVVIRSALYLDPVTAQGRVVSDPLPQILQGVPIDLRSVAVRADRPGFTLNPTSCAEKSFGGQAISTLGQAAPLAQRFQVGGCKSLPYKPKLTAKLFGPTHRGGHPRLKSVFTAKAGEANTRAISFTFPKSEFIDQAHFRTICTRVQFAANQCPAGSVYGHVRAFSPLLDYPLEGPVYLRSSSHKLPDAVLVLRGPAYQPLFFEAAGRVDSVKGGLRVRFESVPDAPLSKVLLTAQGAKKGLFQNSTDICKGVHRATLALDAQSGKVSDSMPQMQAQCGGGGKGKGKGGAKKGKGA